MPPKPAWRKAPGAHRSWVSASTTKWGTMAQDPSGSAHYLHAEKHIDNASEAHSDNASEYYSDESYRSVDSASIDSALGGDPGILGSASAPSPPQAIFHNATTVSPRTVAISKSEEPLLCFTEPSRRSRKGIVQLSGGVASSSRHLPASIARHDQSIFKGVSSPMCNLPSWSDDRVLYVPERRSDPRAGGDPGITSNVFNPAFSGGLARSPAPQATTTAAAVLPHPVAIIPSRGNSLKRSGSTTDIDEEFVTQARDSNNSFGSPAIVTSDSYYAMPPQQDYSPVSQKSYAIADINILYSPSSTPPLERFFAGAQSLSSRTKTLIDLQTFEGCFVLDSALATLLGVSLWVLEARLISSVPTNTGLDPERRKTVWATILAIKMFETQLAGERSVWHLVVDKARAWIAGVGIEDISQFEKMAGEVLGA